jgi:hypothetical protein
MDGVKRPAKNPIKSDPIATIARSNGRVLMVRLQQLPTDVIIACHRGRASAGVQQGQSIRHGHREATTPYSLSDVGTPFTHPDVPQSPPIRSMRPAADAVRPLLS